MPTCRICGATQNYPVCQACQPQADISTAIIHALQNLDNTTEDYTRFADALARLFREAGVYPDDVRRALRL
jgi:hypothetical protein